MPPTSALTATSSANWAALARSPSRTGRVAAHRTGRQPPAGGARPVLRSADEHRDVGPAGALQQAGRTHRPLAVPAHHHGAPPRQLGLPAGQVPELHVPRTGHVAGGELAVLPHVQHVDVVQRADLLGRHHRGARPPPRRPRSSPPSRSSRPGRRSRSSAPATRGRRRPARRRARRRPASRAGRASPASWRTAGAAGSTGRRAGGRRRSRRRAGRRPRRRRPAAPPRACARVRRGRGCPRPAAGRAG